MKKILPIKSQHIKINRNSLTSLAIALSLLSITLYPLSFPPQAHAVVTESFVRFDRLETGAAITGTACMNTATVGTEGNVTIDFPTDWTISGTAANWTISTTNLPTDTAGGAATAWPNIDDADGTGGGVNGNSVTFGLTGSGDLTTATFYCFNFTGASSTIGAAGNNKLGQLKTEGGSPFVDNVGWAVSIVGSGADQITVTASVSATMTFSLSGNSVDLGTLSPSSTSNGSAITQTVITNARNGWLSWVQSNTDGGGGVGTAGALYSTIANDDIDSPGAFGGGTETLTSAGGYVLDVDTGTGTPTIQTEYDGGADQGGHITYGVFRQTATNDAPTTGDTVDLVVKARSSATTPAASDYTDTLTVVAAGSY